MILDVVEVCQAQRVSFHALDKPSQLFRFSVLYACMKGDDVTSERSITSEFDAFLFKGANEVE